MWGEPIGPRVVAKRLDEHPAGVAGAGIVADIVVPNTAGVAIDIGAAAVAALEAAVRIPAEGAAATGPLALGHSAQPREPEEALPQLRPQPLSPDPRRTGSLFSREEHHGRIADISS